MALTPNASLIPPPASVPPIESPPALSAPPPIDSPPSPSSSLADSPPPPSSSSSSAPPSSALPSATPPPPSRSPPPDVTSAPASSPPTSNPDPSPPPPSLPSPSPPDATQSPSSEPPPPPDSQSASAPSSSSSPHPNSHKKRSPPPPPANTSDSPGNPSPVTQLPLSPPDSQSAADNSFPAPYNYSGGGSTDGGIKTSAVVGIGFALAIVLFAAAIVVWLIKRRKRHREFHMDYMVPSPVGSSQMSGSPPFSKSPSAPLIKANSGAIPYSPSDSALGSSRTWFSYEELEEITGGFSHQNILGEGGFGCVYKGVLRDGREVAIKQLKVGGAQGEREFQAEVDIISRVHHRHLVSLVGYCISDNQRLLVYDYVPNKTLHHHLHGHGRQTLDWVTRIKIAAGAARGLAYLHEDCHPRIIHRDIKSSNILLDSNFEALVADFGLAKLTVETNTHVSTRVMGTFGYLAPEYASTGKLTDKSDVFSFGVVLLELITGRKPVDTSKPLGDESLVDWARPLMLYAIETNNVGDLPDPRLENNYNESEMLKMIEAASACVRYNGSMRPRMARIMRALDNLSDSLDINNGVKPGQTQVFNAGPNTQEIKNFQKLAFSSQDYSSDFSKASWSQRDL